MNSEQVGGPQRRGRAAARPEQVQQLEVARHDDGGERGGRRGEATHDQVLSDPRADTRLVPRPEGVVARAVTALELAVFVGWRRESWSYSSLDWRQAIDQIID